MPYDPLASQSGNVLIAVVNSQGDHQDTRIHLVSDAVQVFVFKTPQAFGTEKAFAASEHFIKNTKYPITFTFH